LEEQNSLLKQQKKNLQIKKEEYESKRKKNSNSFSSCRDELNNLENSMKDQLDKFHEFDLAGNMQKLDEMNKQTIIYEQINIALKTTALLNEKQYLVKKF
jgi:hypothetical protein